MLSFALLCGCVLAALAQSFGGIGVGDIGPNWWGGFFRVGFSYALGIWLGRKYSAMGLSQEQDRHWMLAVLPLPATLLLAPLLPLSRASGDCLIVLGLLPAVLWLAARTAVPRHAVSAMKFLGQISYPIYAIHVPMIAIVGPFARSFPTIETPIRATSIIVIAAAAWTLSRSPLAKGISLAPPKSKLEPRERTPPVVETIAHRADCA